MPPKRTFAAISGRSTTDTSSEGSYDDEYRQKRDRNNIAVKKSREKSRQRAHDTAEKMERLRRENTELEQRTGELANELKTLKELLLARASSSAGRRNSEKPAPSPSPSSSAASYDLVALADPHTVNIDHEYTTSN